MTVRHTRQMLWSASVLLAGGSIFALLAGLYLMPFEVALQEDQRSSSATAVSSSSSAMASSTSLPTLASLEPLMNLDLRRPLFDPPPMPVAQVPAPPPPPPLSIRLAGTILEPGRSLAMLITAEGKIELRAAGQSCGEAQIVSIEQNSVTVLHNGQNVTLQAEKEGDHQRG